MRFGRKNTPGQGLDMSRGGMDKGGGGAGHADGCVVSGVFPMEWECDVEDAGIFEAWRVLGILEDPDDGPVGVVVISEEVDSVAESGGEGIVIIELRAAEPFVEVFSEVVEFMCVDGRVAGEVFWADGLELFGEPFYERVIIEDGAFLEFLVVGDAVGFGDFDGAECEEGGDGIDFLEELIEHIGVAFIDGDGFMEVEEAKASEGGLGGFFGAWFGVDGEDMDDWEFGDEVWLVLDWDFHFIPRDGALEVFEGDGFVVLFGDFVSDIEVFADERGEAEAFEFREADGRVEAVEEVLDDGEQCGLAVSAGAVEDEGGFEVEALDAWEHDIAAELDDLSDEGIVHFERLDEVLEVLGLVDDEPEAFGPVIELEGLVEEVLDEVSVDCEAVAVFRRVRCGGECVEVERGVIESDDRLPGRDDLGV